MAKTARKLSPTPRTWSRTTNDTYMIGARIPLRLRDQLRAHVEATGQTITEVVIAALNDYLNGKEARGE